MHSQEHTLLSVHLYLFQRVSQFSQFSYSVVSNSLWSHESQHARPPCPSPTPRVHANTSIGSVMPSSHLILCRSLLLLPPIPPSIRVFSNESSLPWGGQSIRVSDSASVLPVNTQDWSPLGWTGWICLQSKGLARVFSSTACVIGKVCNLRNGQSQRTCSCWTIS